MIGTRQGKYARWCRLAFAAGLGALLASACFAEDAKPADDKVAPAITWKREETMKGAAERIAALHRAQGPNGAYKFIDACYKTHGLAEAYSEAFESCIVQDFLETSLVVRLYAQMPPEQLKKANIPPPQAIAEAMSRRIAAAFATYKVAPSFGDDLKRDAEKFGLPAYLAVVAPKGKQDAPTSDQTKKQRNDSR